MPQAPEHAPRPDEGDPRDRNPTTWLVIGLVFLAVGAWLGGPPLRLHFMGELAEARVVGSDRDSHFGPYGGIHHTTYLHLTFTTRADRTAECWVAAERPEDGRIDIRYLPSDPSTCGPPDLECSTLIPLFLAGMGCFMLYVAHVLYRRAGAAPS